MSVANPLQTASPTTDGEREEIERLLEASFERRERKLQARELAVERSLTLIFLVGAVGLVLVGGGGLPQAEPIALVMLAAYAVASRVDYPIATGVVVPTQLFLVALFAHADAQLVPFMVLLGLIFGTVVTALRGHSHWDRLFFCGGDAVYALGPAILLTATGYTDVTEAPWWILVAAFSVQCGAEFLSSLFRDWLVLGVRPRVQALVSGQIWAVDAALTPVGAMAVAAGETISVSWTPLMLLPLVALVAHTARDRSTRTQRLSVQLEALQRERRRLRVAVRRIGDAFASGPELEALVCTMTRAATEALEAQAGRGGLIRGARVQPHFRTGSEAGLHGLIDEVERTAIETAAFSQASDGAGWALAAPIGPSGDPVALVTIARTGAAFDAEERSLLAYLTTQADAFAANVREYQMLQQRARISRAELERRVNDRTTELADRTASIEALFAEVTEQARELRAASSQQEELLSYLAHEVRGPLYAGDGLLELMIDEREPEQDPDQLGTDLVSVRSTIHEALRIVDEQLESARMRSGALRPARYEQVDLRALLSELKGTFRALLESDAVHFSVHVQDDTPILFTDRHFVSQVLRNLTTNAAKFTSAGAITIHAGPADDHHIRISVQDTGTGVAEADRERIFHDFTQVDEAQGRRHGTGLGLPLTRKLVTALHGSISLESELGVGSTFTVELPLSAAPTEQLVEL